VNDLLQEFGCSDGFEGIEITGWGGNVLEGVWKDNYLGIKIKFDYFISDRNVICDMSHCFDFRPHT